ncbi:maleylpyruvate isomerase [Streptomyces inusitatus]|uniref:Maleylpyruvate isomerase n=1 Tax=Streptomyces inusitatus TaxID=68221 RepID=A0A918QFA6_9ACTN|nr:maleylpyruvate isomerase family mycothiol-dependent enzyme [Streptomyces inusitatus]GGZ43511.1 maleylpyruvate isomerase [Streptomyces inusitatus]
MIDHQRDLASLHKATERLLTAVASLDNARLAAPSRLPGWSRGHVLAHLSRNADALANVLQGRPMYPSAEARDEDIERGAGRPLDVQLADLRDSDARLRAVAALPADWSRAVALRNGVTDTAARLPFRRLVEIELHHVDLDIGYELEDLPQDFLLREIDFLAQRFAGHAGTPPTSLVADGGLGRWSTGGDRGTPLTVGGPAPELVGWLAGRRPGTDLLVRAEAPEPLLPTLPPL